MSTFLQAFDTEAITAAFNDRYHVEKYLNTGIQARIYKAVAKATGESVAIKVCHIKKYTSNDLIENIRVEQRLLKKATDDNVPFVIKYYEGFENEEYIMMVLEWGNGDLQHFLEDFDDDGWGLPDNIVWDFFWQLVEAVNYLHENKIMHRDLKMENILVCCDEGLFIEWKQKILPISEIAPKIQLKLIDFGLSKHLKSEIESLDSWVGSSHTMAPELRDKKRYNIKSDAFSVGAILYQLLTGKRLNYNNLTLVELQYTFERRQIPVDVRIKDCLFGLLQEDPIDRLSIKQIYHRYRPQEPRQVDIRPTQDEQSVSPKDKAWILLLMICLNASFVYLNYIVT